MGYQPQDGAQRKQEVGTPDDRLHCLDRGRARSNEAPSGQTASSSCDPPRPYDDRGANERVQDDVRSMKWERGSAAESPVKGE